MARIDIGKPLTQDQFRQYFFNLAKVQKYVMTKNNSFLYASV